MTDPHLNYAKRKRFFDGLLTIYGRKPVLEALQAQNIAVFRLHLADSNRAGGILDEILGIAERRRIEVIYHGRKELARISRNGKQDQGIAADLKCRNYQHYETFIQNWQEYREQEPFTLIALDGITNPQNLGMIIRSVAASPCHGLLLPQKGCADISPLVIKASAGALFHCPILRCESLLEALNDLQATGAKVCTLSSHSQQTLQEFTPDSSVIYILGNESIGVSQAVRKRSNLAVRIPMNNGVESLNVAVTAALVAFKNCK